MTCPPQVFRDKLLSLYKEKKRSPRSDGGTLVTPPRPPVPSPQPRAPPPHPPAHRSLTARPGAPGGPGQPHGPAPTQVHVGGSQSPPGGARGCGAVTPRGRWGSGGAPQGHSPQISRIPCEPPAFSAELSFPVTPPIPCRHPPSSSSPTAPCSGVSPAPTPLSRAGVPQPPLGHSGAGGGAGWGHGKGSWALLGGTRGGGEGQSPQQAGRGWQWELTPTPLQSAWPPVPGPTPRLGVTPNLLPRHPALGSPPGPPAQPSPPPRRPGGWGDTPGPRGGLQASHTP